MKHIYLIFLIIFFTPYIYSIEPNKLDIDTTLKTIIEDACIESEVSSYYNIFSSLVRRTRTRTDWIEPLQNSLYTTCFLESSLSKTQIAFKLSYGSSLQKVAPEIVENLTSLIGTNTVGIQTYVALSHLWEDLDRVGLDTNEIRSIIVAIFDSGYRTDASRLFSWIYIQFRIWGYNESLSIQKALEYSKPLKDYPITQIYLKSASLVNSIQTAEGKSPEELSICLSKAKVDESWNYLTSFKNLLNTDTVLPLKQKIKWDEALLRSQLSLWNDTRFKWRGETMKLADSNYLVIRLIKDLISIDLPKSPQKIYNLTKKVEEEQIQTGDILFFSTSSKKSTITYLGLYVGQGEIVYLTQKRGVVLESFQLPLLKKRLVAIGRLKI